MSQGSAVVWRKRTTGTLSRTDSSGDPSKFDVEQTEDPGRYLMKKINFKGKGIFLNNLSTQYLNH